jgi:VanZ family protein
LGAPIFSVYHCTKFFLRDPKFSFATAMFWLLLVTVLLCLPGTEFPKITWLNKIRTDKWVHIFMFLILVILWCSAYWSRQKKGTPRKIFIGIAVLCLIYGIMMELVQHLFIPFRTFDLLDIVADGVGCMSGFFLINRWYIKK